MKMKQNSFETVLKLFYFSFISLRLTVLLDILLHLVRYLVTQTPPTLSLPSTHCGNSVL